MNIVLLLLPFTPPRIGSHLQNSKCTYYLNNNFTIFRSNGFKHWEKQSTQVLEPYPVAAVINHAAFPTPIVSLVQNSS